MYSGIIEIENDNLIYRSHNKKLVNEEVILLLNHIDKRTFKGPKNFHFYNARKKDNDLYLYNPITKATIKIKDSKECLAKIREVYKKHRDTIDTKISTRAAIKTIAGMGIAGIAVMIALSTNARDKQPDPPVKTDETGKTDETNETKEPQESTNNVSENKTTDEYQVSGKITPVISSNGLDETYKAVYEHQQNFPVIDIKHEFKIDEARDRSLDEYLDIIREKSEKYGVNFNLFYDICCTEYGAKEGKDKGRNICHIVFDSWQDQIVWGYDFIGDHSVRVVLTQNPELYAREKARDPYFMTITVNELRNPSTSVAVGMIFLRYYWKELGYNIVAATEAYNVGLGNVQDILEEASRQSGKSVEEILEDKGNLFWLEYADPVIRANPKNYDEKGNLLVNPDYALTVFSRLYPEQTDGLNDPYSMKRKNLETQEVTIEGIQFQIHNSETQDVTVEDMQFPVNTPEKKR